MSRGAGIWKMDRLQIRPLYTISCATYSVNQNRILNIITAQRKCPSSKFKCFTNVDNGTDVETGRYGRDVRHLVTNPPPLLTASLLPPWCSIPRTARPVGALSLPVPSPSRPELARRRVPYLGRRLGGRDGTGHCPLILALLFVDWCRR